MELNELFKKATSKEGLTLSEKMELSRLLSVEAENEKKAKFQENIDKVKELIETLGLTSQEVVKALQAPAKILVSWNGHIRMEGERGKFPSWVEDFKKLGKEECKKFVVNAEQKGFDFIDNLFKEKE